MSLFMALLALLAPADEQVPPVQMACLVEAYPDHLDGARLDPELGWLLVWKDGTAMDWDDGKSDKTYEP